MSGKSLRVRLRALERAAEKQDDKDHYQLLVIQVGDVGRVIDDGTEETRPWIGRLASEVPGTVVKQIAEISMADL